MCDGELFLSADVWMFKGAAVTRKGHTLLSSSPGTLSKLARLWCCCRGWKKQGEKWEGKPKERWPRVGAKKNRGDKKEVTRLGEALRGGVRTEGFEVWVSGVQGKGRKGRGRDQVGTK